MPHSIICLHTDDAPVVQPCAQEAEQSACHHADDHKPNIGSCLLACTVHTALGLRGESGHEVGLHSTDQHSQPAAAELPASILADCRHRRRGGSKRLLRHCMISISAMTPQEMFQVCFAKAIVSGKQQHQPWMQVAAATAGTSHTHSSGVLTHKPVWDAGGRQLTGA